MLRANKVIRVWPDTKEKFSKTIQDGETADRALNRLLEIARG